MTHTFLGRCKLVPGIVTYVAKEWIKKETTERVLETSSNTVKAERRKPSFTTGFNSRDLFNLQSRFLETFTVFCQTIDFTFLFRRTDRGKMMPSLTEIAFLIVRWTIISFGVTLLFITELAPFISWMALLLWWFFSLLSFSVFATWLPPKILAFSFLNWLYFFPCWSTVGFHGRHLLTGYFIRAGNVESFIECEGFLSQKLPFCTLVEKASG